MVLNDLLYRRKSQPEADLLAVTHKWLKYTLANLGGDAPAVNSDPHFQAFRRGPSAQVNSSRFRIHGLASIEQQIVKYSLQLRAVEPCLGYISSRKCDRHVAELGPGLNALDRMFDDLTHIAVGRP